jgi:hypothetical protein
VKWNGAASPAVAGHPDRRTNKADPRGEATECLSSERRLHSIASGAYRAGPRDGSADPARRMYQLACPLHWSIAIYCWSRIALRPRPQNVVLLKLEAVGCGVAAHGCDCTLGHTITVGVNFASIHRARNLQRCIPSESKFSGASLALICGHSRSTIENQAVSRLRPFTTWACRNIPSN